MGRPTMGFWVCLGAIALTACTSHPPVSPAAAPAASGGAAVSKVDAAQDASASAAAKTRPPPGYRLVVKDGTEYYCRYEPVVGSRTLRDEICLTKEQMAQGQKGLDDFERQVQSLPNNPQGANPGPRGR